MAILGFRRRLRCQCSPLHHRMCHQLLAIYTVSGDLRSHDCPSRAVNVHWDISNGLDYDYQHVLFCLRPSVGGMDQKLCLGSMDLRRDIIGGDGVVVALLTVWLHFLPDISERVTQKSYSMAHGNETQLSSMTAIWLLPIVSCIVAASSGAIVADVLPNPQHALWTVLVSYVLWGIGVPLAMMVMVIYLQRLTLHKLPPKAVIVSVFLPLGPLGQGGYG